MLNRNKTFTLVVTLVIFSRPVAHLMALQRIKDCPRTEKQNLVLHILPETAGQHRAAGITGTIHSSKNAVL